MNWSQRARKAWNGLAGRRLGPETPAVEAVPPPPKAPKPARGRTPWGRAVVLPILALALLYYPVGSILDHRINDELGWAAPEPPAGASRAVAAAAGLLTREVQETGWVANTPPVAPNAMLKFGGNMMNFQVGQTTAVAIFAVELRDRIGRSRGSSPVDADLVAAESNIREDPERWVFGWDRLLPGDTADARYLRARDALLAYNVRLGAGQATFDARADNFILVLDRIALDLGDSSAQLAAQIEAGRRVLIDRRADKLYYNVKGRAYAHLMILRGLRADFADVIDGRPGVAELYERLLLDLERVAGAAPLIVMNGRPTGLVSNNHLAAQGFYVLRARTQLREISDVLAK